MDNSLKGRMIVEMDLIVKQLSNGCIHCEAKLDMTDTVASMRHGLANVLLVPCKGCTVVNRIETSKKHYSKTSKASRPIYDVNTKCAVGKSK